MLLALEIVRMVAEHGKFQVYWSIHSMDGGATRTTTYDARLWEPKEYLICSLKAAKSEGGSRVGLEIR